MGLFFSFGKVVGVLIAIAIELILNKALGVSWSFSFRIILSLTAVLTVLQSILIFCFGSDTPTEMMERGDHGAAK